MDISNKLLEFVKSSKSITFTLGVVSGILLFLPEHYVHDFKLEKIISTYKPYLFITFIFTFVLTLVNMWLMFLERFLLWEWIIHHWKIFYGKKHLKMTVTNEEKEILKNYIKNETRFQSLDYTSGVVSILMTKYIITEGGSTAYNGYLDYVIHDWAWLYLNKNKELLD